MLSIRERRYKAHNILLMSSEIQKYGVRDYPKSNNLAMEFYASIMADMAEKALCLSAWC